MNKTILHIITMDKFTVGYINFMKMQIKNYHHIFVVTTMSYNGKKINCVDDNNLICIPNFINTFSKQYLELLEISEKIIISGVYNMKLYSLFPHKLLRKTYIHFWGGDFYLLRSKPNSIKQKIDRVLRLRLIRRCHAWINLIDTDYDELSKCVGIIKKHFTAPMPDDPLEIINWKEIHSLASNIRNNKISIIVGNSATPENRHEEVLYMLEKFKNEDIQVICPLSYGNDDYAEYISKVGEEIFGDKFLPITEYMALKEYYNMLGRCQIGIFNNDRQQAMGNINSMFILGNKVFISDETPMWKTYKEQGLYFENVKDIRNMSFEEFVDLDKISLDRNIEIRNYYYYGSHAQKAWERVLDNND